MKQLDEKLCVVTGAGRGIGAAIAKAFVAEGGRVVVTDKDLAAARDVAGQIGATAVLLDVRSEEQWSEFAADYPEIDVLVNNAGVTGVASRVLGADSPQMCFVAGLGFMWQRLGFALRPPPCSRLHLQ